jgi:hypothetical protein
MEQPTMVDETALKAATCVTPTAVIRAQADAAGSSYVPAAESAAGSSYVPAAESAAGLAKFESSAASAVVDDRFLLFTRSVTSKLSRAATTLADWRTANASAEVEDTAGLKQCITTTRYVLAQAAQYTFPDEFYADFLSHATELLSTVEDESDANCTDTLAEAHTLVKEILELPVAALSTKRSSFEAYLSVFQERIHAAECGLPPFPAVHSAQHKALHGICLNRYRQLLPRPHQAELVECVRYDLEVINH